MAMSDKEIKEIKFFKIQAGKSKRANGNPYYIYRIGIPITAIKHHKLTKGSTLKFTLTETGFKYDIKMRKPRDPLDWIEQLGEQ